MNINPLRSFILAGLVVTMSVAAAGDEITEKEFGDLQQVLTPDPNESWRTIPWRIALLDAQHVAAKQGKPIFIWAMDGHPLGCT